ncbi:hypothetical protein ACFX1S_020445 [Malus domestica]
MALEESTIVHHPFIQDQAPTAFWINNVDKSTHPTVLQDQAQKPLEDPFVTLLQRSSPKALGDPFITVLQDQAQKPLKIRSSLFFKIKPKSP